MNEPHKAITSTAITFALLVSSAGAFTVTLFPGSVYDSDASLMDAGLGITGFTIEDFEDVSLVPDLSITYTNPNAGPLTTLPTVYNEATIGNYTNNLWDGDHALVNTPQNQEWNQPGIGTTSIADRVTFSISGGARSFGIGVGNFQNEIADHELLVNGASVVTALETLPDWVGGISVRNGYIRIDADLGEVIDSVAIDIGTGDRDGLVFDHLAFSPIPEPASATLYFCMASIFGLISRRRIHSRLT